jgi:hypothetical protein
MRVRSEHRRTLVYAVNDSPWSVTVDVGVVASPRCRALSLSPARKLPDIGPVDGALRWRVSLAPYDLVAAVFTEPGVTFETPRVEVDPAVVERLRHRVELLDRRLERLANPPPYDKLANAGFEQPAADGAIPCWTTTATPGVAVTVGGASAEGEQAATITSAGRVASLTSDWFDAPETGRLAILVALQTADAARQPPLRIAIESSRGEYRYIAVGAPPASVPLKAKWGEYLFPFDTLPSSPGGHIRIRFDMLRAGEARVDNVRLLNLSLSPEERTGLGKIASLANLYAREGEWSECASVLDGYWPRFVEEHVPLDVPLQAMRDDTTAGEGDAGAAVPSERMLDKFKKKLIPR